MDSAHMDHPVTVYLENVHGYRETDASPKRELPRLEAKAEGAHKREIKQERGTSI